MNEGLIEFKTNIQGNGCDVNVSMRGEFLAIETGEAVYVKADEILAVIVGGEESFPKKNGDTWASYGSAPVDIVTKRRIVYKLFCEGSAAAAHVSLKIIEALAPRDPGIDERTARAYKKQPSQKYLRNEIDYSED